jgi:inosine-uridine nucleoside N-ribohydrolase
MQHPHLTPEQTWEKLFEHPPPNTVITDSSGSLDESTPDKWFKPSLLPSHKETLRILRDNEPNTISIIAIGPLTNLAIAAAEDPESFLRVKEVIVMGGAINSSGNVSNNFPKITNKSSYQFLKVTPVAEFNTFADAVAAARVYALTSPSPRSTFPPPPPPSTLARTSYLPPYPRNLSKQLKVTLFPLDITNRHTLTRGIFNAKVDPLVKAGSPLAEWMSAFMTAIFNKMDNLHTGHEGDSAALSLHDPLCVWYLLTQNSPMWTRAPTCPEDIRVETAGQWTRGMCIVDRRNRKLRDDDDEGGEVPGDTGNWLSSNSGNRIDRMVGSPGDDLFAGYLLDRILG